MGEITMSKYADKEKLAAVKDYLSGDIGFRLVAKQRGIDPSSLRRWIAAFRAHGATGLKTRKRHPYSIEIRLAVLKHMHEEQLSYRQAAAIFDIRNFNIIARWERQYDEGGLIALDAKGNIELPFNSEGMYRASKKEGEELFIGIYKD